MRKCRESRFEDSLDGCPGGARKFHAREIRRKIPVDPLRKLQGQLGRAIRDERYEDAAKLRDAITELTPHSDVKPQA